MASKARPVFFLLFAIFLAGLVSCLPAYCHAQRPDGVVGILISREILPFVEMVEGLESGLGLPSCRIFLDSEGLPYSADPRFRGMDPRSLSAVVAVGPEALRYLINIDWKGILVYGMVLNPERILGERKGACGLSLRPSYTGYFFGIRQVLPGIRRVGVLFDPRNNEAWFEAAKGISGIQGIILVPLKVNNQTDISSLFDGPALGVDAIMFIPDRTVISKAVIEFVIKKALLRGVAVIGYNKFFHDSGAALSFVLDYRGIGQRAASLVEDLLRGLPCRMVGPPYKIYVNMRVLSRLGVQLGTSLPPNLIKD